ncbi:GL16622 [Drosophila persimilis]|uniref:GL16622 n=1 Tax=Drosophila persimilis TaxID=7234 RepID=B4IS23_DROPE|nr:GL16622 [Drosophila persimilis]
MGNFDAFEQGLASPNGNGRLPNGHGCPKDSPSVDNQLKFSAPAYTEIRTRRCNAKAAAESKVRTDSKVLKVEPSAAIAENVDTPQSAYH